MSFSFQLLRSGVEVSDSPQAYGVEPANGKLDLDRLTAAAVAHLADLSSGVTGALEALPKAWVWNDLIFKRVKANWVPYCVQWPLGDRLLSQQVSQRGRCAIRADVLRSLYQAKKIESLTDTSAALCYLAEAEPDSVVELPSVLRFTGLDSSDNYRSLKRLAPAQTATSISVIVNYRDRPDLMGACLKSLAQQTITAQLEVILVDNQSQLENRQRVEAIAQALFSDDVRVIHISYDAPFNHSAQTNLAVEAATGEALLMLNNDAQLMAADTVQTLCDWAMTPKVASAGPQFVGARDRLVSSGVEVYPPDGKRSGGIRESTVMPLSETVRYTAGNSFACAAIAREIWSKVGGLDAEIFPTQYNDADYDLKALALGYDHLYIGHLKVYHQPGQSEAKTREQTQARHRKILDRHAGYLRYVRLAPVMVKLRGPVLDLLLNPTAAARAFMKYRSLHKYVRTKILKRR